jgi:hypothetical protein
MGSPRIPSLALALVVACSAAGGDAPAPPPTEFEHEFTFDAQAFFATNSSAWFGGSEAVLGAEIGHWSEYGIEPGVAFRMPAGEGAAFGALSVVGTYTLGNDASGLTIGLRSPSEANVEQAYLGWRTEGVLDALEGEVLTVTLGSFDYTIGSGLLVADGGSDGAEHGGWTLGMRRAFGEALLVQLANDALTLEAFRLTNRPRAGGPQGDAIGANAAWTFAADTTVGGTLMRVDASTLTDAALVASLRFDRAPELGFGASAELVEQQSDQIEADGGFIKVSYAFDAAWSPVLSYRRAVFSGDDPATAKDERFREIAYGYTDYGSWYQGEISGAYPLGNGNTRSHLVRLELAPNDALAFNVLYYRFAFDAVAGTGLTSDDWGDELDLIVDWAWDDRLSFVGVLGVLAPGRAAEQLTGGDDDWVLGALYASFTW